MTMLERLNAMTAQLDAVLKPERCEPTANTSNRIDASWPDGDLEICNAVMIGFVHADRIDIQLLPPKELL